MTKIANQYLGINPWVIEETGFHKKFNRVSESIFSLANEFMGVRGYFDEGYSALTKVGSYFNGIFERFYIEHPFSHNGMASQEQKMLNSVDWLYTRMTLDGQTLDLAKSKFTDFTRTLDLRSGILSRKFVWHVGEKKLQLRFERFLSMHDACRGFQRISFEPLNFSGTIHIRSGLDFTLPHHNTSGFKSKPFESVWQLQKQGECGELTAILCQAPTSKHKIFSSFRLDCDQPFHSRIYESNKIICRDFDLKLKKGSQTHIDKLSFNFTCKDEKVSPVKFWQTAVKKAASFKTGYDQELSRQKEYWAKIWKDLDVMIEGDSLNQQGIRFCIFNLHQTYHGVDPSLNVPAKGLSGDGYDGKTWWDTETYCLPFYMFNNPRAARNLLEYRYVTLPQACLRSVEVDGCRGARYPMSTIDGTETCYVWQHGDLEIHVSVAVAYGIWHYNKIVGDKQFLYSKGIEMLLEICRYYASRGQFSQKTGEFGFWNVMGPDEFHMQVSNNTYTNYMVRQMFDFTIAVMHEMKSKAPTELDKVTKKVKLAKDELKDWAAKAAKMRTNFCAKTQLFEQHDGFFDLPHIDCSKLPPEEYPVYNHWPYLKIFRWDMIKQPDVLLLMLFFSHDFSDKVKRVNYDYYESRCCHESSLSPAIHSILASELGKDKQAYKFFGHATRLDLDDYNRNAWAGLHITSMAGAWMNIVQGFGGLRTDGDILSFAPSIPSKWKSLMFKILYQDGVIKVKVGKTEIELSFNGKKSIPVRVYGKKYEIGSNPVPIKIPAGKNGGSR